MPTLEDPSSTKLSQVALHEAAEQLASESHAPAGVSAAAIAAAIGLGLLEKALKRPPHPEGRANSEIQVLADTRKRLLGLADSDQSLLAELDQALGAPESEERGTTINAARVAAYRSCRRLLDQTIVGLSLATPVVERSHAETLADVQIGVHLLGAALEGAIACAEDHLRALNEDFAAPERPALERQAEQGRELVSRAEGGLSWRRGKA